MVRNTARRKVRPELNFGGAGRQGAELSNNVEVMSPELVVKLERRDMLDEAGRGECRRSVVAGLAKVTSNVSCLN